MITMHNEHTADVKFNLLNTCNLSNSTDVNLAILRKVTYRNTKDGRPFVRMSFEDVNGYVIVGRMFDIADMENVGKAYSAMLGNLVAVTYTTDFFMGSAYLAVSAIELASPSDTEACKNLFVGKYALTAKMLSSCNERLLRLPMSEQLRNYYQAYCNLSHLVDISDDNICCGLRGYVLNIIDKVLSLADSVQPDSVIAFLCAVITWLKTRQEVDANRDDSDMMFIASMMQRRIETQSAGLERLSDKISEFAALFSRNAHVISADSYMLYTVFQSLVETSAIEVLESRLPVAGYCSYKNYTIRRS